MKVSHHGERCFLRSLERTQHGNRAQCFQQKVSDASSEIESGHLPDGGSTENCLLVALWEQNAQWRQKSWAALDLCCFHLMICLSQNALLVQNYMSWINVQLVLKEQFDIFCPQTFSRFLFVLLVFTTWKSESWVDCSRFHSPHLIFFPSRGCPNSAPISFMTVTLLITHAGNDFLETRDIIRYCSVSRKGLSVLLLTRGQHKFGLLCCFCCFASKHQTCATNGSSYFQHLYPNPIRNHASGRWLRSHMQRKSHFDFIFRRQMKGKVKRLWSILPNGRKYREQLNKKTLCLWPERRFNVCYYHCAPFYLQPWQIKWSHPSPTGSQCLICLLLCTYGVRHEFVDVALSQQHLAHCLPPRLAAWLAATVLQC